MNAIKLAFLTFCLGLWLNTKHLGLSITTRIRLAVFSAFAFVFHVAVIPVHAVMWVVGCLKTSWIALSRIWK